MPLSLPPVLTPVDLPLAELAAARLDGQLFRLGDGFAPIDTPDSAAHRAASLRPGLHERIIAEQHTAAWIWGAIDRMPRPARYAVAIGARVGRVLGGGVLVREVVIASADTTILAGLAVTTPVRTALDLVRSPRFGPPEEHLVLELARRGDFSIADLRTAIEARRNLPHKHEAERRLRRLEQRQPLLTR